MTYEVKYAVGARVVIVALESEPAVVQQISIGPIGVRYEVGWFHSGERKTAWLFDHELSPRAD